MAVEAQYPSNALLFNRSEQERNEMDCSLPHQLPPFANGANGNQRKRGREASMSAAAAAAASFQMVPTPQMNLFSPSVQPPALVSLAQLHNQSGNLVSTGLRLSFEAHNQFLQQDLASLVNSHKDEIERFLAAQGEQLRRTLADARQKHYRALLEAAEQTAARRLREKEVELDRAARRTAELEDRIGRLRNESLTWQAKAMADQATAASLHAQIQQAQLASAAAAAATAGGKPEECGESGAEDAESAHVDPCRVEQGTRACRICLVSDVSVVLLPCRHLCLCSDCDAAVTDSDAVARCPVCHAVRSGSVRVFLS